MPACAELPAAACICDRKDGPCFCDCEDGPCFCDCEDGPCFCDCPAAACICDRKDGPCVPLLGVRPLAVPPPTWLPVLFAVAAADFAPGAGPFGASFCAFAAPDDTFAGGGGACVGLEEDGADAPGLELALGGPDWCCAAPASPADVASW